MLNDNTIPQLGFGAMRLPQNDENPANINMEEFTMMVDYYMDKGFNYFDTSYAYHDEKSENALKKALVERYPRKDYKIADKIPTWLLTKEEDNEKLVNIMLDRLAIDYFDVLLIHNINESSLKQAENANSFEYIKKAKEEGKAVKVGISYHDKADLLEEILSKYSDIIDIVQLQLNYLDWDNPRVQSKKCHEVCVKYDKEITVMEPLKGGTLINLRNDIKEEIKEFDESKTPAYYGLKFAASQENVSTVLSGMNKLSDMKNNCETFTDFKKLSDDELKLINRISQKIRDSVSINCSYCKYCVKECPMNIPIPDFFNLYNTEKMYHLEANHALYGSTSSSYNPASSCIKCGKCMENCTQHLNIPELLDDVSELFE